jgi:hypothetical protein
MSSVDPGPRDLLITDRLERELRAVETDLHVIAGLDPAEAAVRLARHGMDEIRRA